MYDVKVIVNKILEGADIRSTLMLEKEAGGSVFNSENADNYIEHYYGRLGEFDYDTREFTLHRGTLQYIGKETDGSKIKIPKGIKNCSHMFAYTSIKTPPVIPDGVEDCSSMFTGCESLEKAPIIPNSVKDCTMMFWWCKKSIQRAGEWNIEHRGKSYYDDPDAKKMEKQIADYFSIVKEYKRKYETDDYQHNGRSFSSSVDKPIDISVYSASNIDYDKRLYVEFRCGWTKHAYPNKEWAKSFAKRNNLDIFDVEITEEDNDHYSLRFKAYVD